MHVAAVGSAYATHTAVVSRWSEGDGFGITPIDVDNLNALAVDLCKDVVIGIGCVIHSL
jgi:hypothetical protein